MRDYFQLQGYHVDTARTIEEAEKLIKDNKYAAVIQDLRIGGTAELDGLQMIELIRNSHPTAGIVVLTAYGSPEVESRARHVGADAFLRKPTPLSQIAQVVQGVIESPKRSLIKH
jgi:DNA-binding response OmpR family regulator